MGNKNPDARKKVHEILDALRAQGWTVTRAPRRGTFRCLSPDGQGLMFLHETPSSLRTINNYKAQLRRLGAKL